MINREYLSQKKSNIFIAIVTSVLCVVLLEFLGYILLNNESLGPKKKVLSIILNKKTITPGEINLFQHASISPHPYLLYQNTPNYSKNDKKEHNSLGYRSHEVPVVKGPNVFRIIALGGSTTYAYGVPDFRDSWPYRLQEILKDRYQGVFEVEVINAGLPYATSAELLSSWIFRHQFLEPDLVLIHAGGNDIAPLFFPDYNAEYTHFRARGFSYKLPRSKWIKFVIERSHFFHLLTLLLVPRSNLDTVYIDQPYSFLKLRPSEVDIRVKSTYPSGFYRNLNTLVRTIKSSGAKVVLASFVQASEKQIAHGRPDMAGLEKAFVLGLEKNREIMRLISGVEQIPYLEPDQENFPDSLFVDNTHLGREGQIVKAEIFSRFLIERNAISENFTP